MSTLPIEVLFQIVQHLKHDRGTLKHLRLVSKSLQTCATDPLFESIFLRPNTQSLGRATQVANCSSLRCYVRNLELLRDIVHECEGMLNHMRECDRLHVHPLLGVQDSNIWERFQNYTKVVEAQRSFRALNELEALRRVVRLLPRLQDISVRQKRPPDHCDEDDYFRCLTLLHIPRRKYQLERVNEGLCADCPTQADANHDTESSVSYSHVQQSSTERSNYCAWDFSRGTTAFDVSTAFELCAEVKARSFHLHSLDYDGIDVQMPLLATTSNDQFHHLKRVLVDLPDYANERRFRFPWIRDKLKWLSDAWSNVEDLHFRFRNAQSDMRPPTLMKWELCAQLVIRQHWPSLRQLHVSGMVSNEKNMSQFLVHNCPKLRRLSLARLKLHDPKSAIPGSLIHLLRRLGDTLTLEHFELEGTIKDNDWYWNIDPAKETNGSLLHRVKQYVLGKGSFPFPDPEAMDFDELYKQFLETCTHQALVNVGAWKAFPDQSWHECQSLRHNIKRIAGFIRKNERRLEKRNNCTLEVDLQESTIGAGPNTDLFSLSP